jgi:quercetin dioxygenase-like cupin family protein
MTVIKVFDKGVGFGAHRHKDGYSHYLKVLSGELCVATKGRRKILKEGDQVIHEAGTLLRCWAVSDKAEVETNAEPGR